MKLSIVLITYNHEPYLRQCFESILSQQFTFEWELIVAYDKCPDNTLSIIEEYRSRFKNFVLSQQKTNVGVAANCAAAIYLARGEYIATIDGDDYNTDNEKYLKQVAVLDTNPDVSISFCNGYRYYQHDGSTGNYYTSDVQIPQKFTLEEYYRRNFLINSPGLIFRKATLPEKFPDFYFDYTYVDWMLISFCGSKASIYFLDEYLNCYRVHSQSISRSANNVGRLLKGRELNRQMDKFLNYRYHWFFGNESWYNEQLAYQYANNREYVNAVKNYIIYIFSGKAKFSTLRYFLATVYNSLVKKQK